MKVALGAAKGLEFLHSEADVIYRDFKTSNILLDMVCENFQSLNMVSVEVTTCRFCLFRRMAWNRLGINNYFMLNSYS